VLAPKSRVVRRVWSATLGAYVFAALSASVSVARRHGWRHLPLLPVAFAAMHFGYGGGFLTGLVRFASRWGDRSGPASHGPVVPRPRTASADTVADKADGSPLSRRKGG
jgi:hypothetical protein